MRIVFRVRIFGRPVVRLDLRCVGIRIQAECGDEALAYCAPVRIRVGDQVGIEIADGTVEFATDQYGAELSLCRLQPFDEVGDFLAQRRRAGRLAVCA
jgi:hypothetical protein